MLSIEIADDVRLINRHHTADQNNDQTRRIEDVGSLHHCAADNCQASTVLNMLFFHMLMFQAAFLSIMPEANMAHAMSVVRFSICQMVPLSTSFCQASRISSREQS